MDSVLLDTLPNNLQGAIRTLALQENIPEFMRELSGIKAAYVSEARACERARTSPPLREIESIEMQIATLQRKADYLRFQMSDEKAEEEALAKAKDVDNRIRLFAKAWVTLQRMRAADSKINKLRRDMTRLGVG